MTALLSVWQSVTLPERSPTYLYLAALYILGAIAFAVAGSCLFQSLRDILAASMRGKSIQIFSDSESKLISSKSKKYGVVAAIFWLSMLARGAGLLLVALYPNLPFVLGFVELFCIQAKFSASTASHFDPLTFVADVGTSV